MDGQNPSSGKLLLLNYPDLLDGGSIWWLDPVDGVSLENRTLHFDMVLTSAGDNGGCR